MSSRCFQMMAVWLTCLLAVSGTSAGEPTEAARAVFPHERVGNIDQIRFNEPSGICFHTKRGTLFVVGDAGEVCEIETDGKLVKQKWIRRADFEGITHDPGTGLLYIAVEGAERIIEMDPETFTTLREFQVPRKVGERTLLKAGGQGIEAITFVPDPRHPEGGTFYVANQCFQLDNTDDVSVLLELEVPLKSEAGEVKVLRCFEPRIIDLSGLYYDASSDHLFVLSDATDAIMEYSRDHRLLHTWAFPGDNQEGITVDADGFLYIAQDSGGIIKLKWLRER